MKFVKKAGLFAVLAVLLSCATVQNENLKSDVELLSEKIIVGKTSKSDIQAMFNSPKISSFDAGNEVWKFELSSTNPETNEAGTSVDLRGTAVKKEPSFRTARHFIKELMITFDEKGLVKTYSYSTQP